MNLDIENDSIDAMKVVLKDTPQTHENVRNIQLIVVIYVTHVCRYFLYMQYDVIISCL